MKVNVDRGISTQNPETPGVSKVLKPVKKNDVTKDKPLEGKVDQPHRAIYLDEDGMKTMINAIVENLEQRFVTKEEVEKIVIKTLQKLAVSSIPDKKE